MTKKLDMILLKYVKKVNMVYRDLEKYFSEGKYLKFVQKSMFHIKDLDCVPFIDQDLFIIANNFRTNRELDFYIKLNDFFEKKNLEYPFSIQIRTLLLISASNEILISSYLSINKSFFIIHSVADYGLKYMQNSAEHRDFIHPVIGLLRLIIEGYIPIAISNFIFEHLTFTISYAKRYSTDYDFIYGILLNVLSFPIFQNAIDKEKLTKEQIESMPKLIDKLKENTTDIFCINFIIQLLEWCNDNPNTDHKQHFEKLFYTLKEIQELTPSLDFDKDIELSLMRYREQFDSNYDYIDLEDFYETHGDDIGIIHKLRVITQLFLKLNKNKYMEVFEKEISSINSLDLRYYIEKLIPDTFSAYITGLADDDKELFFNFLEIHYSANRTILESTAFYIHRNDYNHVLEKEQHKFDVIPNLHSNIINSINEINNLNITVKYESHLQNPDYNLDRENIPIEHSKKEKDLVTYLSQYYNIDNFEFDDSIEYILIYQQMRVPLQQLLLKKYNKLFPFINIFDKIKTKIKKVEKVIHLVLSTSSTIDQEKEVVNYISNMSNYVVFEYKVINSLNSLMEILNSDEYSVISITTHGEVDTREHLDYKIKIGDEYINMFELSIEYNNLTDKRLLYLNICDSGHFGLKNGLLMESLSTQLTHNSQAVVSNMWPISQRYSSTFLMIFFHQLTKIHDFKKAYKNTLLLVVNNKLDEYIFENDLYKEELELFKIFYDSSIKKESIVNWGSMVYQE